MRRIDVLVPKGMKVDVRVRQVEGLKSPKVVTFQDRMDRIPFVGSFVVKNIEQLGFSLTGDWSQLPDDINQVRWSIIDGGYTDQEVQNEIKQTLKSASGSIEAKRRYIEELPGLLVPIAS